MSEPFEATQPELTPSDLLRPPQEPIVFPNILRTDRRWQQLPPGEIVYIDANKPDTLPTTITMLNQQGHPVKEHGHNRERPFSEPQRVPAVVIHTGPRTPEQAYDLVIEEATEKLTRRTLRDNLKRIKEQHLGFVVIVEDKGKDTTIGWRQAQLTKHGLVKDKDGDEKVVIETENSIVTLGRIEKLKGPVDLSKSQRAANANARITYMRGRGIGVDATRLNRDAEASHFPPRTIENLDDLNGIRITDPLTGCSIERDSKGITTPRHVCENPQEHEIQIPKSPEQIKRFLIETYEKGGLRKGIELEECCGDCGKHLKNEYYPYDWYKDEGKPAIKLLKRRKVCDSRLHRGMPGVITIGNPVTIGALHQTNNR